MLEEIERLRRSGDILYLDYVPEQDLPALYAGAAAFCYFSIYEGFGLPVLEAMASGVPVVCATGSALDELCAGSALQADPHDDEAIKSTLRQAIDDPSWRATARESGLARSAHYSWQRTAERLVSVFAELAP